MRWGVADLVDFKVDLEVDLEVDAKVDTEVDKAWGVTTGRPSSNSSLSRDRSLRKLGLLLLLPYYWRIYRIVKQWQR